MASKRSQMFFPTGLTPRSKISQRDPAKSGARRALFAHGETASNPAEHGTRSLPPEWSLAEEEALLTFLFKKFHDGVISGWPAPGETAFWVEAAELVSAENTTGLCRSSM